MTRTTTLICPKCGRSSDEVKFMNAFCMDCYPFNIQTPKETVIDRCKRCSLMKLKGEWMQYDERKLGEYLISRCRGEFAEAGYDVARQTAEFTITHGGETVKIERRVPLEIQTVMCQQCNRVSGGYFQGIIQLRGNGKQIERYASMLTEMLTRKTFISKTEEKDGGLDIYVGSSKEVVGVMHELGVRALITKKLVGRQQGKRLYRTTFLLRFE